jgi:hypothetical protein
LEVYTSVTRRGILATGSDPLPLSIWKVTPCVFAATQRTLTTTGSASTAPPAQSATARAGSGPDPRCYRTRRPRYLSDSFGGELHAPAGYHLGLTKYGLHPFRDFARNGCSFQGKYTTPIRRCQPIGHQPTGSFSMAAPMGNPRPGVCDAHRVTGSRCSFCPSAGRGRPMAQTRRDEVSAPATHTHLSLQCRRRIDNNCRSPFGKRLSGSRQ